MKTSSRLPQALPRQKGVALFIALISLVAMSLAGLALVRSVDTGNMIAGNLSFRQSALHTTDAGIEAALNALTTITSGTLDANAVVTCTSGTCTTSTCSTAGACNYYTTMQATDSKGVPSTINWNNVNSTTVNTSYTVQWVIDRLCTGTVPVTDITGKCLSEAAGSTVGTKKVGGVKFTTSQSVYYRVTARVAGPRNTVSIVQALLAR